MLDIKTWLASAGEPVAEVCFPPGEAPALPYVVYLDSITRGGSDLRNILWQHALTVERYSNTAEDNAGLEELFDAAAIEYTKDKQWLSDEECYMTTYDFQNFLTEKGS